jgi:hypothetical protein
MMNPDGYMTTHITDISGQSDRNQISFNIFQPGVHRMHRKNRRPQSAMNITDDIETTCDDEGNCEGVDLNRLTSLWTRRDMLCRNFPSGWGEGGTKFPVSSSKPWNSDYKGSHRQ